MKILCITDIHYGDDVSYGLDENAAYVNSYGTQFESLLPALQKRIPEYDLVVNLGDLINEKTDTELVAHYRKAKELLEAPGVPVCNVAGNHDLNRISRDELARAMGMDSLYRSFDLGGYHHVVLDGFRETYKEPHYIREEQLNWLRNDLEQTSLKTLLYCHYPLDEQDLSDNYYFREHSERAFITNRKEVRDILEGSGKVLAAFSGHTHFYSKTEIAGISYITVPAFTENENHTARAECLAVTLEDDSLQAELVKFK